MCSSKKFKRIDDAIKFVIKRLNVVPSTKYTMFQINTHANTKGKKQKDEMKSSKEKKLDPDEENSATY